jgi:protease II
MPVRDEVTGLSETFYDPKESEVVYGVEVFRNFMAVVVEKDGRRILRSVNLKTSKVHTHYFDSQFEVNQSDKQISDFFDANLVDNNSFDTHQVRYKLTTPVAPAKTIEFNMAVKQTRFVFTE